MKKLFLVPLFLFAGCKTPQEKNKEEIAKIKVELKREQDKISSLSQQIQALKMQISNLKQKNCTPEISTLHNQMQSLEQKIEKLSKISHKKDRCFDYIVISPSTLITSTKASVYAKPTNNADILAVWDKGTTFTSYKERDGFVKVTGYFVDGKWRANKKSWWIKKDDAVIKRVK